MYWWEVKLTETMTDCINCKMLSTCRSMIFTIQVYPMFHHFSNISYSVFGTPKHEFTVDYTYIIEKCFEMSAIQRMNLTSNPSWQSPAILQLCFDMSFVKFGNRSFLCKLKQIKQSSELFIYICPLEMCSLLFHSS